MTVILASAAALALASAGDETRPKPEQSWTGPWTEWSPGVQA